VSCFPTLLPLQTTGGYVGVLMLLTHPHGYSFKHRAW